MESIYELIGGMYKTEDSVFAGKQFFFKLRKIRKLRSHSSKKLVQVSMMSSISFLLHFLHVLPLWAALVSLPPLLPVPHLFAVLVEAEVRAAKDLDVVFVSQP